MKRYLSALAVMATLAAATPALADTLLVDRAREKPAGALPVRGQSMQQVQAQFGAPSEQRSRVAGRSGNGRPSTAGCTRSSPSTSRSRR